MKLYTSNGFEFLIDDEDYIIVNKYNWMPTKKGYLVAYTKTPKRAILLHRLIMGVIEQSNIFIDHINGIEYDNRKCNLRKCTHAENMKNRKASGRSKYLGVYIETRRMKKKDELGNEVIYLGSPKIRANIKLNGKNKNLGTFKTEEEAALAYNNAAKIIHGEFARLNIIT